MTRPAAPRRAIRARATLCAARVRATDAFIASPRIRAAARARERRAAPVEASAAASTICDMAESGRTSGVELTRTKTCL
jgi:hypothetical protein